jgi:two-component system, NtrC family, response regulator HydG
MSRSARILVVDDNKDLLNTFSLILKRKGYLVDMAEDGEEALNKYKIQNYDIVLMDVVMPGINGIEVLHKMRGINALPKIILMTAYCEEEKLDQVVSSGEAYSALYKPINIAKLMDLIGEAVVDPLVMVVDDNDDFRNSFSSVLELNGYKVITAASGQEAINRIKENMVDVAFVDVKMPAMNGLETSVQLRELNPEIIIIMMTGYRDEVKNLVQCALQNGVKKCLYKPFKLHDIKELVEQVC